MPSDCEEWFIFKFFIYRDISWSEWSRFTLNNLEAVSKELNGASPLRAYIDTLLTQCVEDLREQRDATNNAFKRRIDETKEAKNKLELQHAQVSMLNTFYH